MKLHHFHRALEQLSGWRERMFMLALAERAWPNLQLFCAACGHEGESELTEALSRAWASFAQAPGEDEVAEQLDRLAERTPDPEQYDVYGVYPAIEACETLEQVYFAMLNDEKRRAMPISEQSLERVAQFVEDTQCEGMDEDEVVRILDQSPLIKRELAFQKELVDALRKETAPSKLFVESIRILAQDDGVSNLGISLDGDE